MLFRDGLITHKIKSFFWSPSTTFGVLIKVIELPHGRWDESLKKYLCRVHSSSKKSPPWPDPECYYFYQTFAWEKRLNSLTMTKTRNKFSAHKKNFSIKENITHIDVLYFVLNMQVNNKVYFEIYLHCFCLPAWWVSNKMHLFG